MGTISNSKSKTKKLEEPELNSASTADVKVLPKKKHSRHKAYVSYGKRVFIYVVLFAVFTALSLLSARKVLTKHDIDPINYTEKESIDYKVYLKENDFYTEKFLPKNKAYIASLIDYIDIDLNYIFSIEKLTKMNFEYKVIGELVIENSNSSNRYFEKEYTILDSKKRNLNGTNDLAIVEKIKIDYGEYNELANRFRASYGVDTNSYLKVYLLLEKKTDPELNYSIEETTKVDNIVIPLSERAIEIKINSSSSEVTKMVFPKPIVKVNPIPLAIEAISFLLAAIFMVKVIKYASVLIKTTTPYDKYVNKILKDYDRLIVEINTDISFKDFNIIEVTRFNELLDVRDNIKMPINYYNITKHEKGIFYIKSNNDIYLLTVKNSDVKDKKIK